MKIFLPKKEDVYNWHGEQLLPESRNEVGINNIVRLQFIDKKSKWWEVIYVKIVDVKSVELVGVTEERIYGETMDTYRIMQECLKFVKNGEIVEFKRENIIEIPYDVEFWRENDNLKHLDNMRTGLGRAITGGLDPETEKKSNA